MPIPPIALPDLIRAIEAQYNINVTTTPSAMLAGVHSAAWLVNTPNGDWVAKVSDPGSDPLAKLQQHVDIYTYLNQHGLHAPQLLALNDGTLIGNITSNQVMYPLQLMRHELMRQFTPETAPDALVAFVGALAAQLHSVLDHYPARDRFIADNAKSANEWGMQNAGVWAVVEDPAQRATMSEIEQDWLRSVDRRAVEYIQQYYPDPSTLSLALLHGDLNFTHIQFLPNGSAYLFDFGDMCWGPIAHELAAFLQTSFRDSTQSIQQWETFQAQLLAGYTTRRPLTYRDRAMIALFIVNRIVAQARYIVELAAEAQAHINWPIIKRTYALAEHLISQTSDADAQLAPS